MTANPLRKAADALATFAARIDGLQQQLVASESPERIAASIDTVPSDRLRSLAIEDFKELCDAFGPALKMEVHVGEFPILSVSESIDDDTVESFRQEIDNCDTAKLTVNIDKAKLLAHWDFVSESKRVFIFIFSQAAANLLTHSLNEPSELENSLWKEKLSIKVVLVVDEDGLFLDGAFWAALGGDQVERLDNILPVDQDIVQQAARVLRACRETVRWDNPFFNQLVPQCFRVEGDIPDGSLIAKLMLANWINACILYTADRVQIVGNEIVGTFATERSRCQIRLLNDISEGVFPPFENVVALGDIVDWAYNDKWGSDRLRMVQVNVSRALAYGEQPCRAASLVVRAKGIWDELEWHWKSFIAGEIDRFVEEERALEGEVAQTVEGFDGQVAEMIKSLSGSMLAAVGVLIGSVIAAAFKGTFNAKVFSIGIWGYVIYLLLFPGLYNMSHHVMRFIAAGSIFEKRRQRIQRLLAPDVVDGIIDDHVWWAKFRFWASFTVTLLAIVGVILACNFAAQNIPTLLGSGPKQP